MNLKQQEELGQSFSEDESKDVKQRRDELGGVAGSYNWRCGCRCELRCRCSQGKDFREEGSLLIELGAEDTFARW